MSLGGDCHKLTRCNNRPTFIATENAPASDGEIGSMSLCQSCADAMIAQCGLEFATLTPLDAATVTSTQQNAKRKRG